MEAADFPVLAKKCVTQVTSGLCAFQQNIPFPAGRSSYGELSQNSLFIMNHFWSWGQGHEPSQLQDNSRNEWQPGRMGTAQARDESLKGCMCCVLEKPNSLQALTEASDKYMSS